MGSRTDPKQVINNKRFIAIAQLAIPYGLNPIELAQRLINNQGIGIGPVGGASLALAAITEIRVMNQERRRESYVTALSHMFGVKNGSVDFREIIDRMLNKGSQPVVELPWIPNTLPGKILKGKLTEPVITW